MPKIVAALLEFRIPRPVEEVVLLALWFLGEEVVGDAHGQLTFGGQLLDDGVVFRVVLEAAAGVDRASHAEPVQFAHEVPGRVHLIFERQFRPAGEGRVQNAGIRLRQQQPGRIVVAVEYQVAAGWHRRLRGVADRAQCRVVQQRTIVEMQDEHRRLGSHRVDLVQCRQPLLGKLVFGEPADDAHPLWRRRDFDLTLQHRHRVGQRAHAIPTQFHVEIEPAANDVQVVVDQARQDALALQVDNPGVFAGERHHLMIMPDRGELAVSDCNGARRRIGEVERGEKPSMQD